MVVETLVGAFCGPRVRMPKVACNSAGRTVVCRSTRSPVSHVGGIYLRIKVNMNQSDCSNKNLRLAERLLPTSLAEISLR
jgi:hypothetical protein